MQQVIHQLKYKKRKDVGHYLGKLYGQQLKKSKRFNRVDIIIPIPLHSKKRKRRGYNQSESFAKGLAESMNIKADMTHLIRSRHTDSQTRKKMYARWENVEKVFILKDKDILENKHILLVDDVVTTGATLEACAQSLIDVKGITLSIATIAYAV